MTTTSTSIAVPDLLLARESMEVALPDPTQTLSQDEEWFVVKLGDQWRQLRLHDYDEIFAIQGLYERVVCDILQTVSPEIISDLLEAALESNGVAPESLCVLDLGAGNGCVAEALHQRGIRKFVGVDISQPGALAADRDRPGLYNEYIVGDLRCLRSLDEDRLNQFNYTAMVCVAALGFSDIPPTVFASAFNRVEDNGWIVFTIKADFLEPKGDDSGFSKMIRVMIEKGILEVVSQKRYQHRVNTAGDGLEYVAFVGRKHASIDTSMAPVC